MALICLGENGTEKRIHIWDVAAGQEARQLAVAPKASATTIADCPTALAFAPDGRTLYSGWSDGSLIAWDHVSGKEVRRIATGIFSPRTLAVSPDNKTLAADMLGQVIRVIDIQTSTASSSYTT